MSGISEKPSADGKKNKRSISARIARAVFTGCFVLGIVLLLISVTTYIYELSISQISTAFNLSVSAREIVNRNVDASIFAKQVMDVYYGMTDEERSKVGTDEYYEKFAEIGRDYGYRQLKMILSDFRNTKVADYIYIGVFDRRTHALVYVVDTDMNSDTYCPIGHWEKVEDREVDRFLNWDGSGLVYDYGDTDKYGYMFTSGVPVSGMIGDSKAYILTDVKAASLFRKALWFVINFTIALAVIMIILSLLITRRMNRAVASPLNKIGTATRDYVRDKRDHAESRQHFSSLDIHTGDELESLCDTMAGMENDLDEYEQNLASITAEKERVETELDLASRIQSDMLPSEFPAFPERTDFDIYAIMNPAREVGGDFYDFFLIDHDRLGIVIADVSGKGIPAALFMMVTKSMIQTALLGGAGAAEALTNVNSQICKSEHEGMFVTVWAGILDLRTGVLTASNAGHEYPIIKKPDGGFEVLKDKHGFVIGGIDGLKYKEYTVELKPGSKLFLYTDGVTEATDKNKVLFGMDRLERSVNSAADGTPEEIIDTVRKDIDVFVGDAEQFDDMTMVCAEYAGDKKDAEVSDMEEVMNKVLLDVTEKAEIKNVTVVTALIDEELEKLECSMKAQMQIDIAIDELFSNIAKYAYEGGEGDARVIMTFCEARNEVSITFVDHGVQYDPTAQEDPDITLPAEKRSIGGLGILLVRKSMNSLEYEYKDNSNWLTIRKVIK